MKRYIRPERNQPVKGDTPSKQSALKNLQAARKQNKLIKSYRKQRLKNRTRAELKFENLLRELKIDFRAEKVIITGPKERRKYKILDFYLKDFSIGIEIDGGYHATADQFIKDYERTQVLKRQNKRFKGEIRFTNDEILTGNKNEIIKKLIIGILPFAKPFIKEFADL